MKILIILFSLLTLINQTKCELKFVFEIFRHGLRPPMSIVKSDKTIDILNNKWEEDTELVDIGKTQQIEQGNRLREKYVIKKKFLDQSYNSNQILMISTDSNRAIMSAYAHLYGLYPPGTGPVLNEFQKQKAVPPVPVKNIELIQKELGNGALPNRKQVFPIHVFTEGEHYVNLNHISKCPKVAQFEKENLQKEEISEYPVYFSEKFPKLQTFLGLDLTIRENMVNFADCFICAYVDQRDLSSFPYPPEILYKESQKIVIQHLNEVVYGDEDRFIARNSMTRIINRLFLYFDTVIDSDKKKSVNMDPKMVIYSSHEANVLGLLIALGHALDFDYSNNYVDFAQNFVIEFSKSKNSGFEMKDYNVELIYKDESIYFSSYDLFREKVEGVLIRSDIIDAFCGFNQNNDQLFIYSIVFLAILSCALIAGIVYIVIKRKKEKYDD